MRARQTDTDENHALQKCFIQRSADSKPLVISIYFCSFYEPDFVFTYTGFIIHFYKLIDKCAHTRQST